MGDWMKKILIFLITGIIFLPNYIYAEEVDLAPSANSAIMIEASTGKIIYDKNSHEKLPPASMTKIMTMLLIMENIDNGNIKWDDKVTASEYASSMGGSQIFLETGETMIVRDLVKGIAIASGNDAAVAMAEFIGGSEESFVSLMNKKANELGLKNTNFKNVTGLEAENHYSSAYDMAIMAQELIKHEEILKYTGTYDDYLREDTGNKFWLVNTNKLVRFYQGVDGLKTGYTSEAGYCLTATAKKNNMRLITVVMKEPDSTTRNSETTAMLNYGFNKYKINSIIKKEKTVTKANVSLGVKEKVKIISVEDVNMLISKSEKEPKITYKAEIDELEAPLKKGDIVGKLYLQKDGKNINTIELTVAEDIDKANIFRIFTRNIKNIISGEIKL